MDRKVVTTTEVGSWMEDLGGRFSEIVEDKRRGRQHPAAVDENGEPWGYDRIEKVTGIPARTVRRMVEKGRTGHVAGPIRNRDAEAVQRAIRSPEVRAEVVQSIAKVDPDLLIQEAGRATGATQPKPSFTEAERELDAFDLLLKLQQACRRAQRHLPDFRRNKELDEEVEETRTHLRFTDEVLGAYLKGKDLTDDIEEFLSERK